MKHIVEEPPKPAPPDHLSEGSAAFWNNVVHSYDFEAHHLVLLQQLCEAIDRTAQARAVIDEHGILIRTADGGWKSNPAAVIEKDSRIAVGRLISQLKLDEDDTGAINGAMKKWAKHGR